MEYQITNDTYKQGSNENIIKGQSLVFLWPLLWVENPPPKYEHDVGTWRTVKNKKRSYILCPLNHGSGFRNHFFLVMYPLISLHKLLTLW